MYKGISIEEIIDEIKAKYRDGLISKEEANEAVKNAKDGFLECYADNEMINVELDNGVFLLIEIPEEPQIRIKW